MVHLPDSENSLWRDASPGFTYRGLTKDIDVDVAIVGGGITGLTAAYLLKQSGKKVAVIEKDTLGGGTTGRTTGKVTSQHGLIYGQFQQKLGKETARLYAAANQTAVELMSKIIKKGNFDCGWQKEDNYVFTTRDKYIQKIKNEAKIAAELGLPASYEIKTPLPFPITAAVKFSSQGKINAQKYILALARSIHSGGSFIFENSNVTRIKDGQPATLRTAKARIEAKHIIVATNVPTWPLAARGGYCLLEYPTESYIVAGRLDQELRGMYISPDDNHYSILPVELGGERLILIGGEGHISGFRVSKNARYQKLAAYAHKRFGVTSIEYHWKDRDYLAYDGVPLVGKLYPWSKNLFVATAFRKWGLSNGTVAAMILHDAILGIKNPWAAVYNSNRLRPIAHIPRTVFQYAKHPFGSD